MEIIELEGNDGSTVELKGDGYKTVFGRVAGFNTEDRTVSRRHIIFQIGVITDNQTEPRVSFQVIGKNPVWVRSGQGESDIKLFRKLEKGELAAGDWFCISSQNPVWFNLKRIGVGHERDLNASIDVSQINPVKEFGFLVIGHEFDCYPKQRIRDVKNWDWFLEETKQEESEDDDSNNKKKREGRGRRKRRKGGGNGEDDDDDDWSGDSEEDKETVAKIRKIERSNYSTRSKDKSKAHNKDTARKKGSEQKITNSSNEEEKDEDEDDTLGGFIVNDDEEEEQVGQSDEEEEFIDDEEELDD